MAIEVGIPTPDGARLWTCVDGSGPPLVLCHGGPGLWDYLGDLASMLSSDFTVYRWDQRACGRSTSGTVAPTTRGTLDDLEVLRTHFGHDRWGVLGHSFGAELALLYALLFPSRCDRVAYVSGRGTPRWWRTAGRVLNRSNVERRMTAQQAERLADLSALERREWAQEVEFRRLSWMTDFVDPEHSEALDAMTTTPFAINFAANRALATDPILDDDELDATCAATRVPILFLHGDNDPRSPEGAAQLAEVIPTASMTIVPGAGHRIEQPDSVKAALTSFFHPRAST